MNPNRLEASDEPEAAVINSDGLDHAEAQALALRFGLDATLPAQSISVAGPVRAVVFDTTPAHDWELSLLEYGPRYGWCGVTIYLFANDRAGLAAAAAWLVTEWPSLTR